MGTGRLEGVDVHVMVLGVRGVRSRLEIEAVPILAVCSEYADVESETAESRRDTIA